MEDKKLHITTAGVGNLATALAETVTNFNENFIGLQEAIKNLTDTGFTGEAANSLKETYNNNVEPKLNDIYQTTQSVSKIATAQVAATSAFMNRIDEIAHM